ncbi:hypothetical protein [Holdemania massiliensis]|uniref:hypothetical protein n=1 Tax=Holdemania massiliensis TaxID=1468449 RepID=UPI001F058D93|nr:hypothetical protein [Holdemania massiliensis]MCH1939858.1 hypothetical protein [Holdemania massiliensis]
MIKVETYIKKEKVITSLKAANENCEEYFVKCEDENCLQYIEDFDYIEGAIVIYNDEEVLLSFQYWDIVDQLWSYILEAFNHIANGSKNEKILFPDQPVEMYFDIISDDFLLVSIKKNKYQIYRKEFFDAMLENAKSFFGILKKCDNEQIILESKKNLKKIDEIKNLINS